MRTTLSLDDDAVKTVDAHSRKHGLSRGKAASELIRRGAQYQLAIRQVNGIPVFKAPEDFPEITTERVRELLDEE